MLTIAANTVTKPTDAENAKSLLAKPFYSTLPHAVNSLFTGREEFLKEMKLALCTPVPDKQRRYVVTGMGGMGKSEVCLKLGEEVVNEYAVAFLDSGYELI